MQNLRVLVTAAGTREPIDPVRYVGNRSSGKMGYAIAQAASDRGAEVILVSGPSVLLRRQRQNGAGRNHPANDGRLP